MSKFIDALRIRNTGEKIPITEAIRVDNWELNINEYKESSYYTLYKVTLIYSNMARVSSIEVMDVAERNLKEQMIEDINYKLYGELDRMLTYLARRVMLGADAGEVVEMIGDIRREYLG